MAKFECMVCGYIYDEEVEGQKWSDLPDDWVCPVCGVDKSNFKKLAEIKDLTVSVSQTDNEGQSILNYLSGWTRKDDELETDMPTIHFISTTRSPRTARWSAPSSWRAIS